MGGGAWTGAWGPRGTAGGRGMRVWGLRRAVWVEEKDLPLGRRMARPPVPLALVSRWAGGGMALPGRDPGLWAAHSSQIRAPITERK